MFRRRYALLNMTNHRQLKRATVILSVKRSETAEGSLIEKKIIQNEMFRRRCALLNMTNTLLKKNAHCHSERSRAESKNLNKEYKNY